VSRVKIDDKLAEIPVLVRADGKMHKTKLHLRREEDQWRVFALSATYPEGEKSINFEAEGTAKKKSNPLQALVGKPLQLAGYTLDGSPLDMSRYAGKVVLVDFWATWCGPCRAEIPNILQNWEMHNDRGFDVIAISVDRDLNALKTFVADEKPPWVVVADKHPANKNSMGAKYGIRGIPAFILLGRDGKVAAVNCRGKRLGQQLAQLLGNSGRKTSQTAPRNNPSEWPNIAVQLRTTHKDSRSSHLPIAGAW
jgi:thiol-disulfide isomerase/thioredoxin